MNAADTPAARCRFRYYAAAAEAAFAAAITLLAPPGAAITATLPLLTLFAADYAAASQMPRCRH